MEMEELCSINVAPLVLTPFATQWSPDNQISLITRRGVHIFELKPTPMSINSTIRFARSIIDVPDISVASFMDKLKSVISSDINYQEIYSLFMEETIISKLNNMKDKFANIIKVAWSPKDLISPKQCALAIITAGGTVELLHKVFNEWYSICDVSSLWLDIMQDGIKSSLEYKYETSSECHAMITTSIKRLQACCATWSKLLSTKQTSFAYLSVAYYNGDISIWKIDRVTNFSESLPIVFVGKIDSNICVKINILHWVTIDIDEHMLIVGYVDGRLRAIKFKCVNNDLQVVSTEQYIDPDYVVIEYSHVIVANKSILKILAIKDSFVLLFYVGSNLELKNRQYVRVKGFHITGITSIAPEKFLITTQDSHIFIIDIHLQLIVIDIKNHLPQTRVQYLGLAHSPNRVLFLNIISPSMMYDHLVKKEPSTMHIFSLKDETNNPLSIIDNATSLENVWDCMEMLRLKAIKTTEPSMVLRLDDAPKILKSPMTLYSLQISMWMKIMMNVCMTKETIPNIHHVRQSKMTRELPLIFVHSACTYLCYLKQKSALSKENLTAMNLLRNYLKEYLASENAESESIMHEHVQETLRKIESYPDEAERCNLCNETIKDWTTGSCPGGHKLPRCTTTLLQITSIEFNICPLCKQMFHTCLEEAYEESRCQLCDVPVLRHMHCYDVDTLKLYGTNFSDLLNKIEDTLGEPEESETSSENVKTNECHTYDCAMDDDDESDKITEKWEEF